MWRYNNIIWYSGIMLVWNCGSRVTDAAEERCIIRRGRLQLISSSCGHKTTAIRIVLLLFDINIIIFHTIKNYHKYYNTSYYQLSSRELTTRHGGDNDHCTGPRTARRYRTCIVYTEWSSRPPPVHARIVGIEVFYVI